MGNSINFIAISRSWDVLPIVIKHLAGKYVKIEILFTGTGQIKLGEAGEEKDISVIGKKETFVVCDNKMVCDDDKIFVRAPKNRRNLTISGIRITECLKN
jgi:hypothetical protein